LNSITTLQQELKAAQQQAANPQSTKTDASQSQARLGNEQDAESNTSEAGTSSTTSPTLELTARSPNTQELSVTSESTAPSRDTQEQLVISESTKDVLSDPTAGKEANEWTEMKGRVPKPKREPKERSGYEVFKYRKEISTPGICTLTIPDEDDLDRVERILEKRAIRGLG
jgi:hypothetical protein